MTAAITHAKIASELLEAERELERQLINMTPDESLRLAAGGHVQSINRDRQFRLALAQAHALTALALTYSGAESKEPVA